MPEVTNKPPDKAVADVAEHLNPAPFGKIVERAKDHVDEPGIGGVKVACDLHRLVRTKVDYAEYANFRYPPRKCLEGEGNCVDTTCLLCSLLLRAGFECRMVVVSLQNRGHMFTEVLIHGSHEEIHDDTVEYYSNRRYLRGINTASVDSDEPSGRWVIADPATSDFLGDTTGLRELGYMRNSSGGDAPQLIGDTDRYRIQFN